MTTMSIPAAVAAFDAAIERVAKQLDLSPDLVRAVKDIRYVRSGSRPEITYRLIRTAGGWQHVDLGCEGWLFRTDCYHVKELNMTTETAIVPASTTVLDLIDNIEDEEIVAAIGKQITKSWVYEFPQGNETIRGLSAEGVEQAARQLAKSGEAIREMDIVVQYEDENEARFVAKAGRYAISAAGEEVLLDVAIRAKRQPKFMKLRNGGTKFDDHWYEKGITKANRNAKAALLPEAAKTLILLEAAKAGRVRQVSAPQRANARVQAPRPEPETPGVEDVPTATEEQRAAMREWHDAITSNLGQPAMVAIVAEAKQRWPYADNNGKFSPKDLTVEHASEYIALLKERHDTPFEVGKEQATLPV